MVLTTALKITAHEEKFLKSTTKQGYNKSEYYRRLRTATEISINYLTKLADSRHPPNDDSDDAKSILYHLIQMQMQARLARNVGEVRRLNSKIDTATQRFRAYKLPQDKYEEILPIEKVQKFIETIVAGHNRAKNAKGDKTLDVYGVRIAYVCLEIILQKLEAQWQTAGHIQYERAKAQGKIAEPSQEILTRKFVEDKRDILGWADLIENKVMIAAEQEHQTKK